MQSEVLDGNAFRLFAQQMKLKMTLASESLLPPICAHSKWKRKYLSCNRDAATWLPVTQSLLLLTQLLIG